MNLIEWINGTTKVNKNTMDQFQNNIQEGIEEVEELSINNSMPIGSGCDYYGTTAPDNYMFADGSAVNRTEYAELFSIIGTTYGEGDGSTTFNLPDKRERVSVMYKEGSINGTSGATLGILGAKGGEFKHQQTIQEMPSHGHNIKYQGTYPIVANADIAINVDTPNRVPLFSTNDTSSPSSLVATQTGGNAAMNIMQSYLVCNYIIKVK